MAPKALLLPLQLQPDYTFDMQGLRRRPGLRDRHRAQLQARAADREVVVGGGLDLRLRVRKVGHGLVLEEVGRTACVGNRDFGVEGSRDLMAVLAVVVVAAVSEAVVVYAIVVGWGGCLWRSMVVAARNMGIVVVGFAVSVVVHTGRWHTPVAAVGDVTWDSPVLVDVALLAYSFVCCRLGYPGCPSQVPVPNCLHLHHCHHHHHLLLLRLLASHHT
jgi:hypothetical protein